MKGINEIMIETDTLSAFFIDPLNVIRDISFLVVDISLPRLNQL